MKTRERAIAGIAWRTPPTDQDLWELRKLYLEDDED